MIYIRNPRTLRVLLLWPIILLNLVGGKLIVKLPSSVQKEGIKLCKDCPIGSFLGESTLSYGNIVHTVNMLYMGQEGENFCY